MTVKKEKRKHRSSQWFSGKQSIGWTEYAAYCILYTGYCHVSNAFIAWKFNNSKWNKYKHELQAKRKLTKQTWFESRYNMLCSYLSFVYTTMADNLMWWRPNSAFQRNYFVIHISIAICCESQYFYIFLPLLLFGTIHMVSSLIWVGFRFYSFLSYFFTRIRIEDISAFLFPNDKSQVIWLRRFCHRISQSIH